MQAQDWCFTSYGWLETFDGDFDSSLKMKVQYIIAGYEEGEDGKNPHFQGFVQFRSKVRMDTVKRILGDATAHLETRRGSSAEARDYCMKEAHHYYEYGDFLERGRPGSSSGTIDWEAALQSAKEGNLQNVPAEVLIRHRPNLIALKVYPPLVPLEKFCGFWFWGPTGVGKTEGSKNWFQSRGKKVLLIRPYKDFWFSSVWREYQVWIFDDVKPEHDVTDVLEMCGDRLPFFGRVKYMEPVEFRPEIVVVTSNYMIGECFPKRILELTKRFREHSFEDTILFDRENHPLVNKLTLEEV